MTPPMYIKPYITKDRQFNVKIQITFIFKTIICKILKLLSTWNLNLLYQYGAHSGRGGVTK